MKFLVTGAAGFIGSHLTEQLLRDGHEVAGLDSFVSYYPVEVKERNVSAAVARPGYTLHRLDLRTATLEPIVAQAEVIIHLAAMPGLPLSWTDFDLYNSCNVQATQRLLQATKSASRLQRFVYASTSSVYGKYASGDESLATKPISPYGVTKLAAEHLCRAYADAFGLPLVVLRYFSVYGPRQRPDMGYYKFIHALMNDQEIAVFGDGMQVRGNTYISDCVAATLQAVQARPGALYNVGGGETATVWDILKKLEAIGGKKAKTRLEAARPGDQLSTFADTAKLRADLGWTPRIGLDEGLARQWEWQATSL